MIQTSQLGIPDQMMPIARIPKVLEGDITEMANLLNIPRSATPEQREFVISQLYDLLHRLNRQQRVQGLSACDQAYLVDVKAEIDRWELQRRQLNEKSEVTSRLEALAEKVLKLASTTKGL